MGESRKATTCLFCNYHPTTLEDTKKWIDEQCQVLGSRLAVTRELEKIIKKEVREVIQLKHEVVQVEKDIKRLQEHIIALKTFKEGPKHHLQNILSNEEREITELCKILWSQKYDTIGQFKSRRHIKEINKFLEHAKAKQKALELVIDLAQRKLSQIEGLNETGRKRKYLKSRSLSTWTTVPEHPSESDDVINTYIRPLFRETNNH